MKYSRLFIKQRDLFFPAARPHNGGAALQPNFMFISNCHAVAYTRGAKDVSKVYSEGLEVVQRGYACIRCVSVMWRSGRPSKISLNFSHSRKPCSRNMSSPYCVISVEIGFAAYPIRFRATGSSFSVPSANVNASEMCSGV